MNQDQAATWASEAHRKRDVRQRKLRELKSKAYMFGHKVFWRTLHLLGIARPYAIGMCKLGLYAKFADGHCHWCGINH